MTQGNSSNIMQEAVAMGFAEAMLIAYNAKNKYRLPMTKLYGNNGEEEIESNDSDENENNEE